MGVRISHGISRSCTGSAKAVSDTNVVYATVQGPAEGLAGPNSGPALELEVKVKHASGDPTLEQSIAGILHKLLLRYLAVDAEHFTSLLVHVIANTTDMGLICNTLLVACLDGGIPLRRMFFAWGNDDAFAIMEDGKVSYSHGLTSAVEGIVQEGIAKFQYIREVVLHAIKDMYVFT